MLHFYIDDKKKITIIIHVIVKTDKESKKKKEKKNGQIRFLFFRINSQSYIPYYMTPVFHSVCLYSYLSVYLPNYLSICL